MRLSISRSLLAVFAAALFSTFLGCTQQNPPFSEPKPATAEASSSSIILAALHPDSTVAGQSFNAQTNGASALAVTTKGATNITVIVFAGEKLNTVFGSEVLLTAEVPARLYSKSGRYEVYLQTGNQRSNVLIFEVRR